MSKSDQLKAKAARFEELSMLFAGVLVGYATRGAIDMILPISAAMGIYLILAGIPWYLSRKIEKLRIAEMEAWKDEMKEKFKEINKPIAIEGKVVE